MKKLIIVTVLFFGLNNNLFSQNVFIEDSFFVYISDQYPNIIFSEKNKIKKNDKIFFITNGNNIGGSITNGIIDRKIVSINGLFKGDFFPNKNGLFGIRKKTRIPFLIKIEDFDNLQIKNIQWAFQGGPILLMNGIITNFNETKIIREDLKKKNIYSAIGKDKFNQVIFVFSMKRVSLKELAVFLKKIECTDAIFLNEGIYLFEMNKLFFDFDEKNIKNIFLKNKENSYKKNILFLF